MKLSFLLFFLAQALKIASVTNSKFKKYIANASVKILIKTEAGPPARLFVFDKGKFHSVSGNTNDFDVALVWKDPNIAFSVMTSKSGDASFKAAAQGKLKVIGMSLYAQWFEDAIKLAL
ncbi:MAG: hypothetical protein ACLPVO_17825 [Desulfomonilaceae bacterium]